MNGPDTRATYKALRDLAGLGEVKWNFLGRFVVDSAGNITLPATDEEVLLVVQSLL